MFTHPIWVHFGGQEKPILPEVIDNLLSEVKQLRKDDPASACQILVVCAVHLNYTGQRAEALAIMQNILALAERHGLAEEIIWANWGACAISFQEGDYEQAAGHLQCLRACLLEQNEWILANFVETVEQSLLQYKPTANAGETTGSSDRTHACLIRLTYDWLGQWGYSTHLVAPEFQADSNHRYNPGQLRYVSKPLRSAQNGDEIWQRFKQILRGELKLRWVSNGFQYHEKRKLENLMSHTPVPDQIYPEATSPPLHRAITQDHSQPEPVASSRLDESSPETTLLVYCLGPFRVYKNDQLIEKWPGNKCKQILKYLVVHREAPINQEILMNLFWQGTDTQGARRNLYQAVYNLRQALQGETDHSYILTEANCYLLDPEIGLWVDSEAFEHHYQNAQKLVASDHMNEAMREFQMAEELYQGEFLEEDRYEDWPLVLRENLKNAYLDALGQLSQHFYSSGQYTICINYCRKILAEDNCREDAHRRVMLSYLNLDQPHLALRQYRTCVEVLKEELDVPPMSTTEELYKQILHKRHKEVSF